MKPAVLRCAALLAALLVAPVAAARSADEGNNPLLKAIQLIVDLQAKIIREGEVEQKQYTEYSRWCHQNSMEQKIELKEETAQKESLEATITKATSDIEELDMKIQELSGSVSTDEQDLKAATMIRKKERSDFDAVDKELSDTINTLVRAQSVLKKQAAFLQQGQLPAQLTAVANALQELVFAESIFTSQDRSDLAVLLQARGGAQGQAADAEEDSDEEDAELSALAKQADTAADSGPKSKTIVDLLANMQEKAEASQTKAREDEMQAKFNFEKFEMTLNNKIKLQSQELADKKKGKASKNEESAKAKGALEMITKEITAGTATLETTKQDCMERARNFEVEVANRKAEMEALATAKKTIQDVSNTGKGVRSGMATPASFVQVGQRTGQRTGVQGFQLLQALESVKRMALLQRSPPLAQLAARIRGALRLGEAQIQTSFGEFGPADKVKSLIKDMIGKLTKEAEDDTQQNAFCNKEMAEAKKSKGDKTQQIEDLSTRLNAASATSAQLKEQVATLSRELHELVKSQAEAMRMRQQEHQEFLTTVKDLNAGLKAVQMALKVLRDYYAKGDESLIQTSEEEEQAPTGSAASGIIGLLEVVESDFSKNLAEVKVSEDTKEDEYKKMAQETAVSKATKAREEKDLRKQMKFLGKSISETENDKAGVQSELDAVLEYYEKLKPQCLTMPVSYEERKKRRTETIAQLKQVLETMSAV